MNILNLIKKDNTELFDKIADFKLSDNPAIWPVEIKSRAERENPFLAEFDYDINLSKVDTQRKTGVGIIVVSQGKKSSALIPIIVQNGFLKPINLIMFDEENIFPLTPRRFYSVMKPRMANESSITQRGNYMNDSLIGQGNSIIRKIASSICSEDIQNLISSLDNQTIYGFEKNGTDRVISFLLSLRLPRHSEKVAMKSKPFNVIHISKSKNGSYKLAGAYDRNPHILNTEVSEKTAVELIGYDNFKKLSHTDGVVAVNGHKKTSSSLLEDSTSSSINQSITEDGYYEVKDLFSNARYFGYIKNQTISYNGEPDPYKLFLSMGDRTINEQDFYTSAGQTGTPIKSNPKLGYTYAYQGSIVGISKMPDPYAASSTKQLIYSKPTAGKRGCFVGGIRNKGICITSPVGIKSDFVANGYRYYQVIDTYGKEYTLIPVNFLGDFVPADKIGDINIDKNYINGEGVLMPDMGFIWLKSKIDLASNPDEFNKFAAVEQWANPVSIVYHQGEFDIDSSNLIESGVNYPTKNLTRSQALFLLVSMGGEPEQINKYLDTAEKDGTAIISGLPGENLAVKQSYIKPKINRASLVKEASVIPDPNAVDTILSLGFISDENLEQFIDSMDILDNTSRLLAKLLFYTNIGNLQIPPKAIENAMLGIEKIIEGLQAIAEQNKQQGQPTNATT